MFRQALFQDQPEEGGGFRRRDRDTLLSAADDHLVWRRSPAHWRPSECALAPIAQPRRQAQMAAPLGAVGLPTRHAHRASTKAANLPGRQPASAAHRHHPGAAASPSTTTPLGTMSERAAACSRQTASPTSCRPVKTTACEPPVEAQIDTPPPDYRGRDLPSFLQKQIASTGRIPGLFNP